MPLRSGLDVDYLSTGWGYLYEDGANISIHLSTRMLMLYVEALPAWYDSIDGHQLEALIFAYILRA